MKPLLLLLALAAFAQTPRVRIFVGESETWEASGFSAGAASASYYRLSPVMRRMW